MGSWSADVLVVDDSATPRGQVTVISDTAPATLQTQKVTVIDGDSKTVHIRHEAIMDRRTSSIEDAVVVKTVPPELQEEVMSIETRPAEDAVWLNGYWHWNTASAEYDWVPGTWRRAVPGMTWNSGRWNEIADGYEWLPGFWTSDSGVTAGTTTRTVYATEAPPALKEEIRSTSPGADQVWISGNWTYSNDEYVWTAGRWESPAAESMIWLPARWLHTSAGYDFAPGHWDYPTESRTYVITDRVGS